MGYHQPSEEIPYPYFPRLCIHIEKGLFDKTPA